MTNPDSTATDNVPPDRHERNEEPAMCLQSNSPDNQLELQDDVTDNLPMQPVNETPPPQLRERSSRVKTLPRKYNDFIKE